MQIVDHEVYMDLALQEAGKALAKGEVPIGAVVVNPEGIVLGKGHNVIEKLGCQTGHAEVQAISKACKKTEGWRLDDCWLYITLEPCFMCLGLIGLSRIKGICYAAPSPQFGCINILESMILDTHWKQVIVLKGLKADESIGMMKRFFERARGENNRERAKRISRKGSTSLTREKDGPVGSDRSAAKR